MKAGERRIVLLDELRGGALICMVIHHLFYDIYFIFGADWALDVFNRLCVLQPPVWAVFIIVSGICCSLSRSPVKRGALVFACGCAVTLVTAVIMPLMGITGAEIYYGILTFMGISMVLAGLLRPVINRVPVLAGIAVCAVLYLLTYDISAGSLVFGLVELPKVQTDALAVFGIYSSSFESADYFPLLPWVFVYFVGVNFGRVKNKFPAFCYKSHLKPLAAVGRQSLWVYMLHQPALYAILFLFKFILNV
ncbi:MAG: DUF1624 domain-containing protein [Clostridiales bacterium]|nr:DUF1624 domain-containing protein [Clostridiales bacterium]